MHPRLKTLLMPWTQPVLRDKIIGSYTLVMIPLTVSTFFTSLLMWPTIIVLLSSAPVFLVFSIMEVRDTRRALKRHMLTMLAFAVYEGHVDMHTLPGEIQEEINVLHTSFHLRQRPAEGHD